MLVEQLDSYRLSQSGRSKRERVVRGRERQRGKALKRSLRRDFELIGMEREVVKEGGKKTTEGGEERVMERGGEVVQSPAGSDTGREGGGIERCQFAVLILHICRTDLLRFDLNVATTTATTRRTKLITYIAISREKTKHDTKKLGTVYCRLSPCCNIAFLKGGEAIGQVTHHSTDTHQHYGGQ